MGHALLLQKWNDRVPCFTPHCRIVLFSSTISQFCSHLKDFVVGHEFYIKRAGRCQETRVLDLLDTLLHLQQSFIGTASLFGSASFARSGMFSVVSFGTVSLLCTVPLFGTACSQFVVGYGTVTVVLFRCRTFAVVWFRQDNFSVGLHLYCQFPSRA